jgi:hypothetical protein
MKPYRSEIDVLIFIAWFLIVSEWIQLNQTLVSSNNARATTHALQGSRAHEVFQIAY